MQVISGITEDLESFIELRHRTHRASAEQIFQHHNRLLLRAAALDEYCKLQVQGYGNGPSIAYVYSVFAIVIGACTILSYLGIRKKDLNFVEEI